MGYLGYVECQKRPYKPNLTIVIFPSRSGAKEAPARHAGDRNLPELLTPMTVPGAGLAVLNSIGGGEYLGRLAKWKAKKARSFYQSFAAPIVDLDAIHEELEKMGGAPDWARKPPDAVFEKTKADVVAWVDSLSKVERDVLQTYFLDDHFGRKSERLPDGIAKALADRHQTTTSNIRHKKAKLERLLREKYPSKARLSRIVGEMSGEAKNKNV